MIQRPPRGMPREVVGVGGDLQPGTLINAYREGVFPMEIDGLLCWWHPDPRGILRPGEVHVSRSLHRSMRSFEITRDTAFAEVIDGCADVARPHGWIDESIREAYVRLHRLGWAHSIEVWCNGELAGGLYGVSIGGLFAAESKFHRVTDASKAAVVGLCQWLAADGSPDRLVDVQWLTPHLQSLGCTAVSAAEYRRLLAHALALPQP
jgi:leucyl/phenylalanyl-tRNA--protein transferase